MMTLEQIFYIILSILSILITRALIPYLKNKYKLVDIKKTIEMIEIAAKAAEQIYTKSGQGELKKKYVLQYLADRNINIGEDELDTMIESTVLELNRWKQEIEG